jgi:hypothetical protein
MIPVRRNIEVPKDSVQLVVVDLAVLDYLSKKLSLLLFAERLHTLLSVPPSIIEYCVCWRKRRD